MGTKETKTSNKKNADSNENSSMKVLIAMIILFVIVLGVVLFYYYPKNKALKDSTTNKTVTINTVNSK